MRTIIFLLILSASGINSLVAQNFTDESELDRMLLRGEYDRVIDTCRQILAYDSLNAGVYYTLGLAYQNSLEDALSLSCFREAAKLAPESRMYNFTLAKNYYTGEKYNLAEPLLEKLCSTDSMKWSYGYYLSSIYMISERYDDAIGIYDKFLRRDSDNCGFIDKIAYAFMKKYDYDTSIYLYNKSLNINNRDLSAIKNLAFLYNEVMIPDTAIFLLTRGIEIDSADMDLYARRAALNYSNHKNRSALDDYLTILSSGDSSRLYLKRIGIGYCKENQPDEAIGFLLKAYERDEFDYETCSYLGQSYFKLKEMKNSIYYYDREISILTPVATQLGLTYVLLAESQKAGGMYKAAIDSYLKALNFKSDPNVYMIIANLYDNNLSDYEKAIRYYQRFLANYKKSKTKFTPDYIETVKKRVEFLKAFPPKKNQNHT